MRGDKYITKKHMLALKAAKEIYLWVRRTYKIDEPLENLSKEAIINGIRKTRGESERTISRWLNDFSFYRIIDIKIYNEHQSLEEASKDIGARTIEEILDGPIDKSHGRKVTFNHI